MISGSPDYSIVLAAGKGTRMGAADCPKVCFPVNGTPAIIRALTTYQACGIPQHIVVVGSLAEKVLSTVAPQFPNTAFAYQPEQLGTANALRCALNAMPGIPDDADILISAGDRIIDRSVLDRLFDLYSAGSASLALVSLTCDSSSGQGRIPCDRAGHPVAVIERADILKAAVYRHFRSLPDGEYKGTELFKDLCRIFFGEHADIKPAKGEKAFGSLWQELQKDDAVFSAAGLRAEIPENTAEFRFAATDGEVVLTPDEALHTSRGNTSIYLVKAGLLRGALAGLNRNNAQQEEYLSDLVNYVYRQGLQVRVLEVNDPAKVLGFNNPAELLQVEHLLRNSEMCDFCNQPLAEGVFAPLSGWQDLVQADRFAAVLKKIYGSNPPVIARQKELYLQILDLAGKTLDAADPVALFRSPGRLNVMGRHVDHQGGNCNLMTISYETLLLAHPRNDDRVVIRHTDPERFKPCEFSLSELVSDMPWDDWNSLVNSPKLANLIREYGVDWTSYIKAAILRLQKKFANRPLRGMDLFVSGNIPMAAGLSSSSSLVVGAAEATVAANRLDTFPAQLVTLCGESEWFVGTRGGSADHAAVKMGSCGNVVKVRFFDFGVEDTVPFPEDYTMVVCDSGIKARKSANAKDQFNHRISCYRAGFELIRKLCPQYSGVLKHLRDVNVRTLHVPLAQIYRIMLMLPETATREQLAAMLPETDLDKLFASHQPPADGLYPVRGVVMFGLAECERSAAYADALKKGDVDLIGELMKISHDGDRVVSFNEKWSPARFAAPVDNATLLGLLSDLESGDPERVIRAQLIRQPGCYACSIPEIDLMADIANRTPGVAGAQLAGAGLGGCMMVLVKRSAVAQLTENLIKGYYQPRNIPENILVCSPIAGAGPVLFPEA